MSVRASEKRLASATTPAPKPDSTDPHDILMASSQDLAIPRPRSDPAALLIRKLSTSKKAKKDATPAQAKPKEPADLGFAFDNLDRAVIKDLSVPSLSKSLVSTFMEHDIMLCASVSGGLAMFLLIKRKTEKDFRLVQEERFEDLLRFIDINAGTHIKDYDWCRIVAAFHGFKAQKPKTDWALKRRHNGCDLGIYYGKFVKDAHKTKTYIDQATQLGKAIFAVAADSSSEFIAKEPVVGVHNGLHLRIAPSPNGVWFLRYVEVGSIEDKAATVAAPAAAAPPVPPKPVRQRHVPALGPEFTLSDRATMSEFRDNTVDFIRTSGIPHDISVIALFSDLSPRTDTPVGPAQFGAIYVRESEDKAAEFVNFDDVKKTSAPEAIISTIDLGLGERLSEDIYAHILTRLHNAVFWDTLDGTVGEEKAKSLAKRKGTSSSALARYEELMAEYQERDCGEQEPGSLFSEFAKYEDRAIRLGKWLNKALEVSRVSFDPSTMTGGHILRHKVNPDVEVIFHLFRASLTVPWLGRFSSVQTLLSLTPVRRPVEEPRTTDDKSEDERSEAPSEDQSEAPSEFAEDEDNDEEEEEEEAEEKSEEPIVIAKPKEDVVMSEKDEEGPPSVPAPSDSSSSGKKKKVLTEEQRAKKREADRAYAKRRYARIKAEKEEKKKAKEDRKKAKEERRARRAARKAEAKKKQKKSKKADDSSSDEEEEARKKVQKKESTKKKQKKAASDNEESDFERPKSKKSRSEKKEESAPPVTPSPRLPLQAPVADPLRLSLFAPVSYVLEPVRDRTGKLATPLRFVYHRKGTLPVETVLNNHLIPVISDVMRQCEKLDIPNREEIKRVILSNDTSSPLWWGFEVRHNEDTNKFDEPLMATHANCGKTLAAITGEDIGNYLDDVEALGKARGWEKGALYTLFSEATSAQ